MKREFKETCFSNAIVTPKRTSSIKSMHVLLEKNKFMQSSIFGTRIH